MPAIRNLRDEMDMNMNIHKKVTHLLPVRAPWADVMAISETPEKTFL
jgi:hypothetical protein